MPWIGVKNPSQVSTLIVDANLQMGTYSIIPLKTSTVVSDAGDDTLRGPNAQIGNTQTTYNKALELTVPASYAGSANTFRITGSLSWTGDRTGAAVRVYRNGVAVGVEKTASGAFSDDVAAWTAGDLLQIYGHATGGTSGYWLVDNLTIKGSLSGAVTGDTPTWS